MHSGWYTSGMAGLGASGGLQGGFSSGGLGGGVVPHSQSYHLGISSMVSLPNPVIALSLSTCQPNARKQK